MRWRVIRAPTTSWWWKVTPPSTKARVLGLPTSWNRAASRSSRSGAGLVHHGQGVGQDVLVPVDRVLLEGQGRQLGQELVGQAGAHHEPQGRPTGTGDHHDLVQLVADPLGRDDGQPVMSGPDRLDQLGRRVRDRAWR